MALAIATLCFWPPLSIMPLSPTIVSTPWGRVWVKSITCARFIASSKRSSETWSGYGAPYNTFSRIVPENNMGS